MSGVGGKFLDLLYPPQCIGCDLWYSSGGHDYLCLVCLNSFRGFSAHILYRSIDGFDVFSCAYYAQEIITNIVHALKYECLLGAAKLCGSLIAPIFDRFTGEKTVFIPVPLHTSRLHERGFNQAEIICWLAGKKPDTNFLVRLVKTKKQAQLSEEDRLKNVSNAFYVMGSCDPETLYVLVDDVVTSGSTLRECARALRAAGANRICAVTVASTNSAQQAL